MSVNTQFDVADVSNNSTSVEYDVCIIGGGAAGLCSAIRLRQLAPNLSIAVLDAGYPTSSDVSGPVPQGFEHLLGQLQADHLRHNLEYRPAPNSLCAWGSPQLDKLNDFSFANEGAWQLDRQGFENTLGDFAISLGITLMRARVYKKSHLEYRKDLRHQWLLEFQQNRDLAREQARPSAEKADMLSLLARFVIDASGRRAVFARDRQSRAIATDSLIGLFTLIDTQPETAKTLIEAAPNGWWYSARLPSGKTLISLMTDKHIAQSQRLRKPELWLQALRHTRHMREHNTHLAANLRVRAWPAQSFYRSTVIGARWLATGDAAACFDPLSGQGLTKAMQQGILAADATAQFMLGDNNALSHYQKHCESQYWSYYRSWQTHYAKEQRWSSLPFWQPRQRDFVHLSPQSYLRPYSTGASLFSEAIEETPATPMRALGMASNHLHLLSDLCDGQRQTWQVLKEFKYLLTQRKEFSPSDEMIIRTLQKLTDTRMLLKVIPPQRPLEH